MAIKTTEELMATVKSKFGEDTSDDVLSFIEDLSDTITDLNSKASDPTNWKQKYEDNDAEWRRKYRERFFSASSDDYDVNSEEDTPKKITKFEDLFTKEAK